MNAVCQPAASSIAKNQAYASNKNGVLESQIKTTGIVLPACNLFISENFALAHDYSLAQMENLVTDVNRSGYLVNYFDQLRAFDRMRLTEGAIRIRDTQNAGGNSIESETLSFELLKRCYNASLLKTEMEVNYWPQGGSITDYVCTMFNTVTVAVSVTRAVNYKELFSVEDAYKLLSKKLRGVKQSSRNSMVKWTKQILHVWVLSDYVADCVLCAWNEIDASVRGNTVMIVTVANKSLEIFVNKDNKKKMRTNFIM